MKRHTTVVWESIVNISYNLLNTYNNQALYKNITAIPSQLYEVRIFFKWGDWKMSRESRSKGESLEGEVSQE